MADEETISIYQELLRRNAVPDQHKPVVDELVKRGVLKAGGRDFSQPGLKSTTRMQEIGKEADFREKLGAGGFNSRFADTISIGAFNPLAAALSSAGSSVGKALAGNMPTPVADYTRERDVQDELLRRARDSAGIGGTAAEIGLSLPFFAAQAPSVALNAPNLLAQGWNAAKQGAKFGGIYGLNSARGGIEDQVAGAAGGAAMGAALGPALHYGISAAANTPRAIGSGVRALTGRTDAGVAQNAAREAEFAAAQVQPFGPEIGGDTSRTIGRSLARSDVSGAPIRAQAAGTIDDIQRNAQRALDRETAGAPVSDLGAETQRVLGRNLRDRTRTADELRGLPQQELDAIRLGQTADSYPTQASAGYESLNRQTPPFQRNPLGARGETPSDFTATRALVDEFGVAAKRNLQNPGYRSGRPFGQADNESIGFEHQAYLSRMLGDDIANRLQQYSGLRARNSPAIPGPQGLRDFITVVGKAKRDAEQTARVTGMPRTEQAAALSRLETALKADYHRFLSETGPQGQQLSQAVRAQDTAYRQHLEEVRRPLGRLFGQNVQPMDAMNRLVTAAERGDLATLRPYMRVMTEKDNPTRAAAAIVSHMTNNARTLDDFVQGYGRINPQARGVLFGANGQSRALQTRLDQLEAIGRRMQPYQQAIQRAQQYGGNIRAGHIPLGAMLYYQFIPTMVAIAGQSAVARFMASPRYVQWLTTAAQAPTPQALTQHISRLGFMVDAGGKAGGRATWKDSDEGNAVKNAAEDAARKAIKAIQTGIITPAQAERAPYLDVPLSDGTEPGATGSPPATTPMEDEIAAAAKGRGIDPTSADPQAVIDAAWEAQPTDSMAQAIEAVAKRYGLKAPWDR